MHRRQRRKVLSKKEHAKIVRILNQEYHRKYRRVFRASENLELNVWIENRSS